MMNREIKKLKVVAVSGGFDPPHVGHIRLFQEARKLGDRLVVILNNDNWIKAKKGYTFMPEKERREVIKSIRWVDKVIVTKHPRNPADMSVARELRKLKPDIFANGGDRTLKNIPEVPVCNKIGCKMVFNVGKGGKIQSSSWLLNKANKYKKKGGEIFKPKVGQTDYTNIHWAPVINCVMRCGGKILLVRRSDNLALYPNCWNGVSGFLDDAQSLEEKVEEELREELGLSSKNIKSIRLGRIFDQRAPEYGKTWIVHPVLVDVDTDAVKLDWEAKEYGWFDLKEVKRLKFLPGFEKVLKSLDI